VFFLRQLVVVFVVVILATAKGFAGVEIRVPSAVVIDAVTGQVLVGKNIHEMRSPASLTKIATTVLALELGQSSDVVSVSRQAAEMNGASAGLRSGDKLSLRSLVTGTFFRSGNDGAVAIAEHIAGSVEGFAVLMNQYVRSLGLVDTRFANPHGLDEANHYSTAYDLAQLTRAALQNEEFAVLSRTNLIYVPWAGRQRELWNINSFLWRYHGSTGVKTGYTSQAGYSLAASASRNGRTLILVLLGASTSNQRWVEAASLLDYAFNNYIALAGTPAEANGSAHVVEPGDTLWAIALMYGCSIDDLIDKNGLSNPNLLRKGQVLRVP